MTGSQKTLGIGLALASLVWQQAIAQEMQTSNLLGRIRLRVEAENPQGADGAKTIPLTRVNRLAGGRKIVLARLESYIDQKKEDRKDAWLAFYVVSPTMVELGHNGVYDNDGSPIHPEWQIPDNGDARILGLVFSHKKWSDDLASKIRSALNDPDYVHFITQLANYADLNAEQDVIKKAADYWEESQDDEPLVALLDEFASRYRFDASRLDKGDPAILQLDQLMRAVTPALMSSDPRDPQSSSNLRRVARSVGNIAGSAASVGVPFAGLIKGLTTLATNISVPFKKIYDIEPVLLRKEDPDNITLHSLSAPSKPHETVYLGAMITRVEKPDTVEIKSNQHLPIGQGALLHLERSIPQLHRARDWELVNADTEQTFKQISVSQASLDTLKLNWEEMSNVAELPNDGRYVLEAAWDWDNEPLKTNEFRLHSPEPGEARVHPTPENPLVAGKGPVPVELEADDFQFVDKLELFKAPERGWEKATVPLFSWKRPPGSSARELRLKADGAPQFRLSNRDTDSGKHPKLAFDLDTAELSPGFYHLGISSFGKTATDADLTIYPPDPVIRNEQSRINIGPGEPDTLTLKGTGLEWICGISSEKLTWQLHDDPKTCDLESWPSAGYQSRRTVMVSLNEGSGFEEGECQPFQLQLLSRTGDRSVEGGCVEVVGPRPSIDGHQRILPVGADPGLREDEIPAGMRAGFKIQVKNLGSPPSLELGCVPAGKPFQAALTLGDGQRQGTASLNLTGNNTLFLSLDPGGLYVPGCFLTARLKDRTRGLSNSYSLGKVIRLPRIERFVMTRKRLDDLQECQMENEDTQLYEGILTGEHLYQIVRTGWNETEGCPVAGAPAPSPTGSEEQNLRIPVPWPPPAPHAPLFIWLHGEETGRATGACVIDESGCP
ncbi:MAG: hypothetical protein OXT71_14235 [Acidobacteriota bacterium]|nr:hypothetical protein [Acidobacteriota bacterium]